MGDVVDNIPGVPKVGPVKACEILSPILERESEKAMVSSLLDEVAYSFHEYYDDEWEERMLEQGQLLWVVRELDDNGSPVIWQRGKYE